MKQRVGERQAAVAKTTTVPSIETGMCQVMVLRQSMKRPPSRIQLPTHSRPMPPKSPQIGLLRISEIIAPWPSSVRMTSSGVAMVMALASLFTRQPVRSDVGITGEITLRGRVLPVGGIKMKVLAAHRAGIKTILLPKWNEKDLIDIPPKVRDDIEFHFMEKMIDVLKIAIEE